MICSAVCPMCFQCLVKNLVLSPFNIGEGTAMQLENSAKQKETLAKEEGREMSDVTTARTLIQEAYPAAAWGSAKAAIWQAYRSLKLTSERRARAIWNGEVRRVDSWEMEALRDAALRRARIEHERTKGRIATLEAALRIQSSDGNSLSH